MTFFNDPKPDNVVKYIVTFNSGREGERDLEDFLNYWDAIDYIGENHTDTEIEKNNISVCTLLVTGERVYED